MVDTDPTWLGAVLAKHAKDNSPVAVLNVETEPAVAVGENYSSDIHRAILQVVLGSGKVTTRKVIVKKALTDLPDDVASDMARGFNVEGIVYNEILSKYETLMNENNSPYGIFWPDCIFTSNTTIIFEDLKTSGFTLGPRKVGLDTPHVELVLTSLARLHSLSLAAVSNGIIFPKILPPYFMMDSMVGETFLRTALKAFAAAIRDTRNSPWSNVHAKISNLIKDVAHTLATLYKQPHKLSVVNHGDCWNTNMMFKYNSHGTPTELKFVDFQMGHYNSYAWDLTYFLFSSVSPKCIASNYDSFIKIYCNEFSDTLARVGHDTSQAPTIDEVKYEMIRLSPFALTVCCTILPVAANPGDVQIGLEDLVKDSSKFKRLFEDKRFEKTIQEMLNNLIYLGML